MKTRTKKRIGFVTGGVCGVLLVLWVSGIWPDRPVSAGAPSPSAHAAVAAAHPTSTARPANAMRVAKPGVRSDYIVQASSVELARRAVEDVGGEIVGELGIIRAVGASLDARELAALREKNVPGLHIYEDGTVGTSSVAPPETYYPSEVAANTLHEGGVTGRGVTVAVLDTGIWREKGPLQKTSYGRDPRVLAQYDVILAREDPTFYPARLLNKYGYDIDDLHGHGTHVSSVIASSAIAQTGRYQGVAPGVNLVSVRVLDSNGMGRYFDVIRGIQWVMSNRTRYGIRVINLSLSAPPQSHY